ncbi:uncharacterized protein K452DRAFT_23524 [Aplosporella prunicola CBS 121167]|uniref:Uncharacterized protein n=1 Tax=Aplosporella prunicola CBS 121167 TaxID=1176127 RepID=A0A6A6BHA8_9PEZI|nr:uncharacterized protein K452DRAFT_23524 [Aplosporella prunicola CBS 121167]KAF2141931.1 hypothetical protein K452DRAFT_23524 [Aplosporella prunicola CBS 121167]
MPVYKASSGVWRAMWVDLRRLGKALANKNSDVIRRGDDFGSVRTGRRGGGGRIGRATSDPSAWRRRDLCLCAWRTGKSGQATSHDSGTAGCGGVGSLAVKKAQPNLTANGVSPIVGGILEAPPLLTSHHQATFFRHADSASCEYTTCMSSSALAYSIRLLAASVEHVDMAPRNGIGA